MTQRRSLVEGVKESSKLTPEAEQFVYGDKRSPDPTTESDKSKPSVTAATSAAPILPHMTGRISVSARCRPEVASAIKRVSLQRQLAGIEPYTSQDIMEQALERWLEFNGYA